MCKECKEVEMNDEVEQEKEFSIEDLSREELIETVYNLLSTKEKEIDLDNSVIAESDSFKKGVEKASFYAGFYSCLVNCGVSTQDAFELMLNQNTCDNNQELQRIVNESSEKIAKIQEVKIEQSQI